MAIPDILEKLLDSKFDTGKNYIIALILLILFSLNILGFDILKISELPYIIIILLVIIILALSLTTVFLVNKLNDLQKLISNLDEIPEMIEKEYESFEKFNSKFDSIKEDSKKSISIVKRMYNIMTGKPNITSAKIIILSDLRNMYTDIYNEYVYYLITVSQNTTSTSIAIAINNLEINLNEIIKENTEYIHKSLQIFEVNESLSNDIVNKIKEINNKLIIEIKFNKEICEKLYVIYVSLKLNKNEIEADINSYLRTVQTNVSD